VAQLLVQANRDIARLRRSRQPYHVLSNHLSVRKHTHINLARAPRAPRPKINAQLVPMLSQPTVHDPHRFGTKYPIRPGVKYVTAEIVGEDGKPYAPRKQWKGISDEPETFRSPFARYIHPPAVGSSADVVNKDPNTQLTAVERKGVVSLQLRLKQMLDKLGANIVWDHSTIKNRRFIADFEAIKAEARALMEEYELRTGVKTIAWQLSDDNVRGLTEPNAAVTDLFFGKQPELKARPLQRKGSHTGPPKMSDKALRELMESHGKIPPKPREQIIKRVAWKKQADGVVKAKVNLKVIDSKVPVPGQPPLETSRLPVAGKRYPSGRIGRASRPVKIDVVAPKDESLTRNRQMARPPKKETPDAPTNSVNEPPRINL